MIFKHEGKYNSNTLFLTVISQSLQKYIIAAKLLEIFNRKMEDPLWEK